MFIGIMSDKMGIVENALNNGADISITVGEILEKYNDL